MDTLGRYIPVSFSRLGGGDCVPTTVTQVTALTLYVLYHSINIHKHSYSKQVGLNLMHWYAVEFAYLNLSSFQNCDNNLTPETHL